MGKEIRISIVGDDKKWRSTVDDATKAGEKLQHHTHEIGKEAFKMGAAFIGTGGAVEGIKSAAEAAIKGEASQAKLATAYKTARLNAEEYDKQNEKLEATGRRLGFMDDQIRDSLGTLIIATHDQKKAQRELSDAEDLARTKKVSLAAATKAINALNAGSVRPLKMLGLQVEKVTTAEDHVKKAFKDHTSEAYKNAMATAKATDKTETQAMAIKQLEGRVHGQAKAYSETTEGAGARYHAQMEHLEETLGKGLLPALTQLANWLGKAADYMGKHTREVKIGVAALAGLVVGIYAVKAAMAVATAAQNAMKIAQAAWTAVSAVATAAQWAWNAAIYAGAAPVLAIIAAIALLGVGIYELIKHWGAVKDAMQKVFDWVKGTFIGMWDGVKNAVSGVYNWIKQNWPLLLGILTGPIGLAVEQLVTHWATIKRDATNAIGAIRDFVRDKVNDIVGFFTSLPGRMWNGLSGAWDTFKSGAIGLFNKISGWASRGVGDLVDLFKNLPGKLANAVKDGIQHVLDAIGSLIHRVLHFARKLLGIASPSEEFAKIGEAIIHGLMAGIERSAGAFLAKVKDVVTGPVSAAKNAGAPFAVGPVVTGGGGDFTSDVRQGQAKATSDLGSGPHSANLVAQVDAAIGYALRKGWRGRVTSGYRSYAEQAAIWEESGHGTKFPAARPGQSNHERGTAIDVSDYGTFGQIMAGASGNERLFSKVPRDPVHFSITGFAKGGIVRSPTLALIGEAGPEAVVPLSRPDMTVPPGGGGSLPDQIGRATGSQVAHNFALIHNRLADLLKRLMDELVKRLDKANALLEKIANELSPSGGAGGGGEGGASGESGGAGSTIPGQGGGRSRGPVGSLIDNLRSKGIDLSGPPNVLPKGQVVDSGGPPIINIDVHVDHAIGSDLDKAGRELAEPIRRELLRVKARNGSLGFT